MSKGQLPNSQTWIYTIAILGTRVCLTEGYGQKYEGRVCSLSMFFIWYILYQTQPRGRPDLAIPGMRGTGCSVHLACGALAVELPGMRGTGCSVHLACGALVVELPGMRGTGCSVHLACGALAVALLGMRGTGCSVHLACGALAVAYTWHAGHWL